MLYIASVTEDSSLVADHTGHRLLEHRVTHDGKLRVRTWVCEECKDLVSYQISEMHPASESVIA